MVFVKPPASSAGKGGEKRKLASTGKDGKSKGKGKADKAADQSSLKRSKASSCLHHPDWCEACGADAKLTAWAGYTVGEGHEEVGEDLQQFPDGPLCYICGLDRTQHHADKTADEYVEYSKTPNGQAQILASKQKPEMLAGECDRSALGHEGKHAKQSVEVIENWYRTVQVMNKAEYTANVGQAPNPRGPSIPTLQGPIEGSTDPNSKEKHWVFEDPL